MFNHDEPFFLVLNLKINEALSFSILIHNLLFVLHCCQAREYKINQMTPWKVG